MSDSRGDFLAGLLVGGVIGLAVGVLFAPAEGRQTRTVIRTRAEDAVERVRSGAEEVGDRVREGIERARTGAAQLAAEVRSRLPLGNETAEPAPVAGADGAPGPQPAGA